MNIRTALKTIGKYLFIILIAASVIFSFIRGIIDLFSEKHLWQGIITILTELILVGLLLILNRYKIGSNMLEMRMEMPKKLKIKLIKDGIEIDKYDNESITKLIEALKAEETIKKSYPKTIKYLDLGYINYIVNLQMKKGINENVRAEIFFNKSLLGSREEQENLEIIHITKKVTVKLIPDKCFEVKPQSSETQIILDNDKTVWNWEVKPIKSGTGSLQLVVSAAIATEEFGYEMKDIETFNKDINIQINPVYTTTQFFKTNWQWAIGLVCGSGILFAIFKAIGWIK